MLGLSMIVMGLMAALALAMKMDMAETIVGPVDEGQLLQAAVTKTASFDSAAVDMGEGYAPNGPGQPMLGVIDVTVLDLADANETYSFVLQDSDDNATFAPIGVAKAVTAVGVVQVKGFATRRYVRLALTAGGTTPSITYKAYLRALRMAA